MSDVSLVEPPNNPDDLLSYPAKEWDRDFVLHRISRKGNGTWFFSNTGGGRFDLIPPSGGGTCYFGTDGIAALLEVFRNQPISSVAVEARTMRRVRVARARILADTTDLQSRAFGMTKEIATLTPYALCQRWAERFAEASFDGIFHHLRHDVRGYASGVSLFGPAGPADPSTWELPDAEERPITGNELSAAGLVVLPPPPVAGLRVLP